jgi:hypothetical protein
VTLTSGLNDVDKSDQHARIPAFISGNVKGPPSGSLFALAVNGRIAATGRTFLFNGGQQWYGAVVPPSYLHNGDNQATVYLIRGSRLVPLSGP